MAVKHTMPRLTNPHRTRQRKRKVRYLRKVASAEARRLAEVEKQRVQGL